MRKAPDNNSTGLFRWRTSAFVAVGLLLIAVFAFWLYENLPRQSRIVIPNAPPKSAGSEEPWPEILEREKREAEQQQQRLAELRRQAAAKAEEERQARVATEAEAKRQEAELQRQAAAKAQEERVAAEVEQRRRHLEESDRLVQRLRKAEQERQARMAEQERQARTADDTSVKPKLPPIMSQPSGGGSPAIEPAPPPPSAVPPRRPRLEGVGKAKPADASTATSAQQQASSPPAGGSPAQLPTSLPQFPWPPPASSASWVLPKNWFESFPTVGEVVKVIVAALERNGYVEKSFFEIKDGGVALVTRLERIGDDGSSFLEPQRWAGDRQTYTNASDLIKFLRGLFFVDPGHYRVIVFVLRDLPFTQSSQTVTTQTARSWLTSGANLLPPEMEKEKFGDGRCTVIVYEFASDGRAVRLVDSHLTGKEHLTKAGLLSLLAKD